MSLARQIHCHIISLPYHYVNKHECLADSSAHFEDRIREYKASVFVGGNKGADGYQPDNSNSYNEAEDDTDSDFEDDDDIRPRPSFSDRYRNLSSADRRTEIRHYGTVLHFSITFTTRHLFTGEMFFFYIGGNHGIVLVYNYSL